MLFREYLEKSSRHDMCHVEDDHVHTTYIRLSEGDDYLALNTLLEKEDLTCRVIISTVTIHTEGDRITYDESGHQKTTVDTMGILPWGMLLPAALHDKWLKAIEEVINE